jgi:hypothetical protein
LIEQALDELNVQYQTLYHDSDIDGMKPLRCKKYLYLENGRYYPSGRFGFKAYERRHLGHLLQEGKGNENWGLFIFTGQSESKFSNTLNGLVNNLNENYCFAGSGLLEVYKGKENQTQNLI